MADQPEPVAFLERQADIAERPDRDMGIIGGFDMPADRAAAKKS